MRGNKTLIATAGFLLVAGLGWAFLPNETASETLKRTQHYTKLVGGVQSAQDRLNTFVEGEQKACSVKDGTLQLSAQGMLSCLVVPKATTGVTAAPPQVTPEVKK